MDITREEWIELFQRLQTQQEQQIDILMMILKAHNESDAELLDFAHNKKQVFLSSLSSDGFDNLIDDFRRHLSDNE